MFVLREFIMRCIKGMVEKEPEYKVMEYALGWLDKGVLDETDLETVNSLLAPEETAEEPADTTDELDEPAETETDELVEETEVMTDV